MKLKQKGIKKVRVQLLDEEGKSLTFTVYETELKELEQFIKDQINDRRQD